MDVQNKLKSNGENLPLTNESTKLEHGDETKHTEINIKSPAWRSFDECGTSLLDLEPLFEKVAQATANEVVKQLKSENRIKHHKQPSFLKTEELLFLYKNLDRDNPTKIKINEALTSMENDEYFGIIQSRYFDKISIEKIAEIYDVSYLTIRKHKNRICIELAKILFPELLAEEIIQRT